MLMRLPSTGEGRPSIEGLEAVAADGEVKG